MDERFPGSARIAPRPSRRRAARALQIAGTALGLAGLLGPGLGGMSPAALAAESLCAAANPAPVATGEALSVADVAQEVGPAVVTITNEQTGGFGGSRVGPVGAGSGFIIDQAGDVITNAHVVAGADKLTVALYDGTIVPATVVGQDDVLDIAVIKLELPAGTQVPGVATLGDSDAVRPGDRVVAIGSALGEFTNTVSDGTVNAVDRTFQGYGLASLIQHDAEIWHGNSGGPLLNLRGEVVGVNAAGIGGSPMGFDTAPASIAFAIESNPVCKSADQLLAGGTAAWPYLGIEVQPATDGTGVEVVQAVPGGPAAAAGLREGDVITAFDGTTLDAQHPLAKALITKNVGDMATLTVQQGGAERTVEVTLAERPDLTAIDQQPTGQGGNGSEGGEQGEQGDNPADDNGNPGQ